MKQNKRGKASRRRRASRRTPALTAVIVLLVLVILGLSAYTVKWFIDLARIRSDGERYRQLYPAAATATATATQAPTPEATLPPTAAPTAVPTEAPTSEPTATPASSPTGYATLEPMPTANDVPAIADALPTFAPTAVNFDLPTFAPTDAPTPEPTEMNLDLPTFAPTDTPMPKADDRPLPTPDADTLVIALPTPPPVQDSFKALLELNPDTVGFLQIDNELSLPVAQRENDNDYYLTHTFEGGEAIEGALFLDGMNRLVPEDDCLIVYGHNMKNDTMFGRLSAYGDVDYLKQHSIVRFDTLYENRSYVPFAAFAASTVPGDKRYFDVRQFIFDDATEYEKFVLKLQGRSVFRVPVDVAWGDRLLLLVTCDYRNREGRFILALRQLREGEEEANVWAQVMQADAK